MAVTLPEDDAGHAFHQALLALFTLDACGTNLQSHVDVGIDQPVQVGDDAWHIANLRIVGQIDGFRVEAGDQVERGVQCFRLELGRA